MEIRDQPGLQALAPRGFGDVIDRINAAIEVGLHHSVRRRIGAECHDVQAGPAHVRLQTGGNKAGMRLKVIENARQQGLLQIMIIHPSDRRCSSCNQRDHRGG